MAVLKKPGSDIDSDARVSASIADRLNFQISVELDSAQKYRALAAWCDYNGLFNTAKFLNKHAEEELLHMVKVQQYAMDRNVLYKTPAVKEQQKEFKDFKEVLTLALEHEKYVTSTYEKFADMCLQEKDYTTFTFVQWFLKEQVEEEDIYRKKLDRIKVLTREGVGILEIDEEWEELFED